MSSKRKITNTKPAFGNARSFAMNATRRRFNPNLQTKRLYLSESGEYVRVRVTAAELKTIDKIGLREFLRRQGRTLESLG